MKLFVGCHQNKFNGAFKRFIYYITNSLCYWILTHLQVLILLNRMPIADRCGRCHIELQLVRNLLNYMCVYNCAFFDCYLFFNYVFVCFSLFFVSWICCFATSFAALSLTTSLLLTIWTFGVEEKVIYFIFLQLWLFTWYLAVTRKDSLIMSGV